MPKFNDIKLADWKEETVFTDSLWLFPERAKHGKHTAFYHGNFVPQIPNQLIRRYTKRSDVVLDAFIGSGTTAFECEELGRSCIGIDIQQKMVDYINSKIDGDTAERFTRIICANSTQINTYQDQVKSILAEKGEQKVQLAILHPPYADIIKFSEEIGDLSKVECPKEFVDKMVVVFDGVKTVLKKGGYMAVIMGDKYEKGTCVPLGFYCMYAAMKAGLLLKATIVKNMEGNRQKTGKQNLWRYRALSSDYYIFKHEYIFVFKYTK